MGLTSNPNDGSWGRMRPFFGDGALLHTRPLHATVRPETAPPSSSCCSCEIHVKNRNNEKIDGDNAHRKNRNTESKSRKHTKS